MLKIFHLAWRNLTRYKRRSLLTGLLVALGVIAVVVFGGLSESFKGLVVGEITDSMLGHLQVHRKGYVSSIENLPLDKNIPAKAYEKLRTALEGETAVSAYSPRIKFGGMLSNFETTTSIRLNGVDPDREDRVVPDLRKRITTGRRTGPLIEPGEILAPELLAKGLNLKPGDTVVLVATNLDGSVNGITLKVAGILEGVTGPGGRDGYIHIQDAAVLLRLADLEVSEVAVRLKDFDRLDESFTRLAAAVSSLKNKEGQSMFEVHTWADLSPFANIAQLIDIMTIFIKFILIAVVLVSVLNVMIMSVYERVREIGTLAAIGTTPGKILSLFLAEGLTLGLISSVIGALAGTGLLWVLNLIGVEVTFGRNKVYTLAPSAEPDQLIYVCLIVILVSALASLQPAAKAARLEPVEALRHV